jgi:hypothetical protein
MEWVRLHSESISGRQGYAAGYKRPVELKCLTLLVWLLKNGFRWYYETSAALSYRWTMVLR